MQHASDSKHCRRCGAAYVYDAVYLGHLGRYHCPACGQQRPDPTVAAEQIKLDGTARRHASRCARRPAAPRSRSRCPASTTSTTRSARPRCACRWASRSSRSSAGLERVSAAFGRAERIAHRRPRAVDPADQEPGGRQRDPAHAGAWSRASSTCSASSTTASPTAATSRGSGTRTSSCWPAASGGSPAPGTRAAELALRLQVRRRRPRAAPRRCPSSPAALDEALAARRRGRLFALPTYTALLELRDELGRARARGAVLGRRRRP